MPEQIKPPFRLTHDAYARMLLLIGNVVHRQTIPTPKEIEDAINGPA